MPHLACPVDDHIPKSGDKHQKVFRCLGSLSHIQGYLWFVGTIGSKNANFNTLCCIFNTQSQNCCSDVHDVFIQRL